MCRRLSHLCPNYAGPLLYDWFGKKYTRENSRQRRRRSGSLLINIAVAAECRGHMENERERSISTENWRNWIELNWTAAAFSKVILLDWFDSCIYSQAHWFCSVWLSVTCWGLSHYKEKRRSFVQLDCLRREKWQIELNWIVKSVRMATRQWRQSCGCEQTGVTKW